MTISKRNVFKFVFFAALAMIVCFAMISTTSTVNAKKIPTPSGVTIKQTGKAAPYTQWYGKWKDMDCTGFEYKIKIGNGGTSTKTTYTTNTSYFTSKKGTKVKVKVRGWKWKDGKRYTTKVYGSWSGWVSKTIK